MFYPYGQAAVLGKGEVRQDQSQIGGGLPIVTTPCDQTKILVIEHAISPTKPYQDLCSRCETPWCVWIGLPTLTRIRIWLARRYRIVLPNITSREINRLYATIIHVLLCHTVPLGLCPIHP